MLESEEQLDSNLDEVKLGSYLTIRKYGTLWLVRSGNQINCKCLCKVVHVIISPPISEFYQSMTNLDSQVHPPRTGTSVGNGNSYRS
jgi:hypothetical protein